MRILVIEDERQLARHVVAALNRNGHTAVSQGNGAEGLRALHVKGHHTIAQDEATSAVYGMPKAAAQLHAATEILPLDKIAARLTSILAQKSKLHG